MALAVLVPRSAPAQLAAKRLDGPAIRAALAGHTIDFPFPSWSTERATAYLAAGGVWRGRYEGRRITGHWSIKNELCLSFPTNWLGEHAPYPLGFTWTTPSGRRA